MLTAEESYAAALAVASLDDYFYPTELTERMVRRMTNIYTAVGKELTSPEKFFLYLRNGITLVTAPALNISKDGHRLCQPGLASVSHHCLEHFASLSKNAQKAFLDTLFERPDEVNMLIPPIVKRAGGNISPADIFRFLSFIKNLNIWRSIAVPDRHNFIIATFGDYGVPQTFFIAEDYDYTSVLKKYGVYHGR